MPACSLEVVPLVSTGPGDLGLLSVERLWVFAHSFPTLTCFGTEMWTSLDSQVSDGTCWLKLNASIPLQHRRLVLLTLFVNDYWMSKMSKHQVPRLLSASPSLPLSPSAHFVSCPELSLFTGSLKRLYAGQRGPQKLLCRSLYLKSHALSLSHTLALFCLWCPWCLKSKLWKRHRVEIDSFVSLWWGDEYISK